MEISTGRRSKCETPAADFFGPMLQNEYDLEGDTQEIFFKKNSERYDLSFPLDRRYCK